MTIKAIIFDLDGTIAAFNIDYKTARAEVRGYLLNMGIPASLISVKENIFEMLKKTELFLKNSGKPVKFIEEVHNSVSKIAEKYELEAAESTSLLPGAVNTLKDLKNKGLKIGLCTINSANSTGYILKRFRIGQYFDAVVARDKVVGLKPNPEHCGTTLKILGVDSSETLIVGDSITDMKAANEIKAIAIGLTTGASTHEQLIGHGASYIVTSIKDLPSLVEMINKNGSTAS
jgi:HAD superfamily hydrolase (TIGR01549 family)